MRKNSWRTAQSKRGSVEANYYEANALPLALAWVDSCCIYEFVYMLG